MAKPNYQFEKRRRENEKQRKKEEKRLRKLAERQARPDGAPETEPAAENTEDVN
jgi:hypothetical protein